MHFSKTDKSFARAFSTPALLVKAARRVEGRSSLWVLRVTPLTFFASKAVDFVHRFNFFC
jgi:hypothetical protein